MKSIIFTSFVSILLATGIAAADKPNILWITSEDNSPYLGCYGDETARTPNIDAFAKISSRYENCFSNAAVCAPARQTLITGIYATSLGGQHMRSDVTFPDHVKYFPSYLKNFGYFTTNNNKTDYNGGPRDRKAGLTKAWDQNGNKAHWKNRPSGRPFFSVFNLGQTHESRLFPKVWEGRELKTDPKHVKVPKYLPDTSTIRLDIARYYDCIEEMDLAFGKLINEIKSAGLMEETIIFYFSDHGGSLPRGKSYIYDSGTRVPLIVHIPKKWKSWRPTQPSKSLDRLVSFVDFAPTVLNLAGISIPEYMQGIPFLGPSSDKERDYVFTFRGRRGERYNIMRGVRDKKYLYIRNFSPHEPLFEHNGYSFGIPGYADWARGFFKAFYYKDAVNPDWSWPQSLRDNYSSLEFFLKAGDEHGPSLSYSHFPGSSNLNLLFLTKPDTSNINTDDFVRLRSEFREALKNHILSTHDSLFYSEGLKDRDYNNFQNQDIYKLKELYDFVDYFQKEIWVQHPASSGFGPTKTSITIEEAVTSENSVLRYWGIICGIAKGRVSISTETLEKLLDDPEPLIQILAARALAKKGQSEKPLKVLKKYLKSDDEILQLNAILAVDYRMLDKKDTEILSILKTIDKYYAKRVADWILADRKL